MSPRTLRERKERTIQASFPWTGVAPVLARGFHEACKDLAPEKKLVIFPGTEGFPLGGDVEVMGVNAAMELLRLA